ncbi:nucleotidyltransferase domain-containing protein [Streptomyces hainanensis]|uniref:Nucleotidyltransferase domain-containing protein n=1 Tax=Streptomyces hainanensis TaxID=402648 RepID=A0A4R4SFX9_9ACTN|nr:nucleotidyltransferase domain-containing protein [Streptomyces hainanensis]TDC62318.1 nucleotidyltransferase domain-containing protein [Streptomyces hainanensis]
MNERGLSEDGTIAREGSLERVPAAFRPVVAAARARIGEVFGDGRLHSAYLYGSVPRGTATVGVSDLDLQLALRREPTARDRADASALEAELDRGRAEIDGVGILLSGVEELLGERGRYDGGFFVACLCTPLLGDDLGERLPRYRPSSLLARETNGDLALLLPRWRARAAEAASEADRTRLARGVARRVVRTGFTLVMPRWGGWTSDLAESAEIFGRHHPERADQMRAAAAVGRRPTGDPAVLRMLIDDLGPWLATTYTAAHGEKAPRAG